MDINHNNNIKEVYISFDNDDPSISSSISFLRAAFNRQGIYYIDDDKDRLFVEQIRVLVVVFSRNYKFFLPENIVNHLKNKDFVVVPVLHGVTVTFVKQQIAELEHMCMRGLEELDVLSYHIYNDEQSESQFIEEIAKYVFEKLYPTEEIGIHKLQQDIEDLLCKQRWGIRILGILGEPGIGKTTLAKAVFRRMSTTGYDAYCFIKDFHKQFSEKRLVPLSDEFFGEIPMEGFDQDGSISEPRSRRKRVLIVLDDVQNAKDAELYLGGKGFGPGSLIIITSRSKQVLAEFHINESETYELRGLNQEDALKLFTRSAFGKDLTDQNTLDFSRKEIENANGNPSTIRAHAASMKKMEPDVRDVLNTNQESSPLETNTNTSSMWIVPYEEEEVYFDPCTSHHHNVEDFINSIYKALTSAKSSMSTYKRRFMCIVMYCFFGWLWYLFGIRERLGLAEPTLFYLGLAYFSLSALLFL